MSRATKCDRCEKLFRFGEVTIEGSIIKYSIFKREVGEMSNHKRQDYPRADKLELCKKCAEPIKKLLFNWWWKDE